MLLQRCPFVECDRNSFLLPYMNPRLFTASAQAFHEQKATPAQSRESSTGPHR